MTENQAKWQARLADAIDLAREYDRRGDVVLRNQVTQQLLSDENGIPLDAAQKALREAGLIRKRLDADLATEQAADDEAGITATERRHWGLDD